MQALSHEKHLLRPMYDLNHLPPLDAAGWVIEQLFLRKIKEGLIPNLKEYLGKLNSDDWTCLLAENPRREFLYYLDQDMQSKLDWIYIMERQIERKVS